MDRKLPGSESNFYRIIASQLFLFQWYFLYCHNLKPIQSSPGFPQNYPNGVNCVYRIVAGAGLDVILTFTALDIEADAQCRWDSLAINFQLSGQSNTVCGNLVSPNGFTANPITGVGPVSLTMTADDGVNGGGFQINYEIINPDPCIGGWQIMTLTKSSLQSLRLEYVIPI